MKPVVLVVSLLFAQISLAGDWPQILYGTRSGVAVKESLAETWPASGPKKLWQATVGQGYAGPAILGDRVVLFHRVADQERVECFSLASGNSLWTADYEATYRGGIDSDIGPRCVPVLFKDRVYVFGAGGDMHCVALASGKKLWSRALAADYSAPDGYFGAGSSPIVAGERLWVNLGGRKNAGLVALDLDTGKTLFQGTDEEASYSSPVAAEVRGKPGVIFVTRYHALAIDAYTGGELSLPFGKRGPTVNAASPLVCDNRLFLSASYNVGAKLVDLKGTGGPRVIWENDDSMSSQYTTCVYRDGYFYGVHGREDVGTGSLRCIEAATGKIVWSEEDFGIAHVILAEDKLLVVRTEGEVVLAPASPKGFTSLAKHTLGAMNLRPLPALAGGKLVLRSVASGGKGSLLALDVGK